MAIRDDLRKYLAGEIALQDLHESLVEVSAGLGSGEVEPDEELVNLLDAAMGRFLVGEISEAELRPELLAAFAKGALVLDEGTSLRVRFTVSTSQGTTRADRLSHRSESADTPSVAAFG